MQVTTMTKKTRSETEAELDRSQAADIQRAEVVRGSSTQPVTFRASAPLLERLDAMAEKEHRTRANLIQHILWSYVHDQEGANKRR
jgi:hypothetical protein